jgi:hypothetical protein
VSDANSAHRRRHRTEPLRAATRSDSARARRELRGWRTRKLGVVLAAMPVVIVAGVGIAMAAPRHHQPPPVVCATGAATSAAAAAATTTSAAANAANAANSTTAAAASTSAAAGSSASATTTGPANNSAYRYGHGHSPSASAHPSSPAATTAAATSSSAAAATSKAACATTTASATAAASTPAAAAATPNPNCTLIVPANPLSAKGLATPYQLVATDAAMGACHEANANQSAFVEAAIVTAGGKISLYDPLVIDQGTQPAAPTVPAQVPGGSAVGIWFGFNGTNLTLQSAAGTNALAAGNCVNGMAASIFGQFAYCNAPNFFKQANNEIAANRLRIPPVGTAKDGLPCPTTRDFSVVDQDQSDNVVTHYLATANGQIAQNNTANTAKLANAVDLANGSDNLLLTAFMDPALGCTPFTAPDQSSNNALSGALPLDELSAAANQRAPIALVPLNDPMTLNNANMDANKTSMYRVGVDQPRIGAAGGGIGSGATYCTNLFGTANGIARVFKDMAIFQNAPSVDTAMATNLFTFLAMRANQSYTNLNCQGLINKPNPIALSMNGNGVVTAAVMVPLGQTPPTAAATTTTPAAAGTTATTTASASPKPSATASKKPKKVHW